MRRQFIYILIAVSILFAACESTSKEQAPQQEEKQQQTSVSSEPTVETDDTAVYAETADETQVQGAESFDEYDDELEEEPDVVEISDEDEEYERSINNMEGTVSKENFVEDKKDILARIKKLDDVMARSDFLTWKTFVEPDSLSYWSLKGNLRKVSAMLPIKGIQLNSLEDYFKFVFIQSRIGRQVDEIRYVSDSYVKAVQVTDSQDVVYYYFVKINGIWKVTLPPLSE